MKYLNNLNSQKGAVFLLTALMLPLLLACGGIAFDLSNMYALHSKLQTAADAAAIAGARNFNLPEHPETESNHPYADEMAEKFVHLNYNKSHWDEIKMTAPQVKKGADNYYYYRVHLKQDAPYYILRYFKSVLGSDAVQIDAIAYARIIADPTTSGNKDDGNGGQSGGGNGGNAFKYFDNLMTVVGNILGLNSTQNPDVFNRYNGFKTKNDVDRAKRDNQRLEISSFYDGVILLGGNVTTNSFLFTNAAQKYRNNAIDALKDSLDGYKNEPQNDPNLSKAAISGFVDEARKIAAAKTTFQGASNGNQSFNISNLNTNGSSYDGYRYTNNNGGDFQINTSLNGDSNKPFYVIIDKAANPKIQMSANVDTNRPIVYCYLGTNELWVTGAANATFRGIIYAPNASKVSINDNGWNFYGSIVANNLDLQAKGTYNYSNFLGNGGSTPGTPGTPGTDPAGTPKRDVHLTSQPKGIIWDED